MADFKITEEYIELIKLLKVTHVAATGGHAKILVDEGEVEVNGQVEFRKRAKLKVGDIINCSGQEIRIVL